MKTAGHDARRSTSRRVATSALLTLALSACGGGVDENNAEAPSWDTSTETTVSDPAEDRNDLTLKVHAPSTVYSSHVRVRGTVTPGASVDIDEKDLKVASDGRWSTTVSADRGKNAYLISARKPGHEAAQEVVNVTRKRTQREIAQTIKAREERRRRDAEEIVAEGEARRTQDLEDEIARVLDGSGEKMSKAAARIISDRCTAGAIDDFDICFEAGFVIGKNAAESTIDKYSDE